MLRYIHVLFFAFIAWAIIDFIYPGWSHFSLNFLLDSPKSGGREGGILPILTSTGIILVLSLSFTFFVGSFSSIALFEFLHKKPKARHFFQIFIFLLAGTPSIVFGLFGHSFFAQFLGMGLSLLSGALTLCLMCLPLYIYSMMNGLNTLPANWREQSISLGLSSYSYLFKIVLPHSKSTILLSLALTASRSLAETAALIFTSGYVDRLPESLYDSGRTLSVHIFDLAMNVTGGSKNAYTSVFVLVLLIFMTQIFYSLHTNKVKIFLFFQRILNVVRKH